MATIESQTSANGRYERSALTYDGFISYSHAADGLLAPRLQSGLQRFAKPWWKRRALRIFRDESSLSANPHLWSSITEALDQSGWFVLLLSPDAVSSEWVDQEIEYWREHNDPSRILPVLTDGTFEWTNGDVTGSAVPTQLEGVFSEEPRWVDMRFARDETDLDLKDPRFADAVADIASALREVPKDELASEEVKQHRRTVRTAWGGAALVGLLAVAATVFAFQSSENARRAEAEATRAEDNAAAEANARAEADINAQLAEARELGASAINVLEEDPELSILLALEAMRTTPEGSHQPIELVNALWQGVQEDRLTEVRAIADGGAVAIALDEDGSLLATSAVEDNTLRLFVLPDWIELWSYTEETTDVFGKAFISPNGRTVAVSIWDSSGTPAQGIGLRAADELPARMVFLDTRDGSVVQTVEYTECQGALGMGWSPQGSYFAVSYIDFDQPCAAEGAEDGGWVELLDGGTFERVALVPAMESSRPVPAFDADENLYVFGPEELRGLETFLAPDFRRDRLLEDVSGSGEISDDGSEAVTWGRSGLTVVDLETGRDVDRLTPNPGFPGGSYGGPGYSADGSLIFWAGSQSNAPIWEDGERIFNLHGGPMTNAALTADNNTLYTGHVDGTVKVWSLRPEGLLQSVGDLGGFDWVNADVFSIGEELGAVNVVDLEPLEPRMLFFDRETGEFTGVSTPSWSPVWAVALTDDRFAFRKLSGESVVYDAMTGAEVYLAGCETDSSGQVCTDTGDPAPRVELISSIDRTELAVSVDGSPYVLIDPDTGSEIGPIPHLRDLEFPVIHHDWLFGSDPETRDGLVIDRSTGDELARLPDPGIQRVAVSESGDKVVFTRLEGVTVIDTESWQSTSIDLEIGAVRGVGISPSSDRVALGDENGLHIVNLETQQMEQSVPLPSVSDIHWFDEESVLVGGTGGIWVRVDLAVEKLVSLATESLTRGFTPDECDTYRIAPCPTLDEMRSG
jgi:WD40 repeat protein